MSACLLGALNSRSPRGERGLKFLEVGGDAPLGRSLPSRGAWIEIQSPFWRYLS